MTNPHERLSKQFEATTWHPRPPDANPRARWFAMGDPQTTFAKVLEILGGHGLLGDDGFLRSEVGLVSIGDHFDFAMPEGTSLAQAGRDGANILRWLAEHPPDQVVIMIGNHDTARVMELAFETDETFAVARALAIEAVAEDPPGEKTRAFATTHPRLGPPGLAERDFSCFAVYQRDLVQALLLAGRMRLACLGRHAGKPILITHAGVTDAETRELAVAPRADLLVDALEARLHAAVERVGAAWKRKEPAALALEPLHVAAQRGREGGGFLYHRPSNKGDHTGDKAPLAPRRFAPRALPRGLVQVCGHSGHKKSLEELAGSHGPSATLRERGGLRTLSVGEGESSVVYDSGIAAPRETDATMYFIDIEMNSKVPDYPLFELESVDAQHVSRSRSSLS